MLGEIAGTAFYYSRQKISEKDVKGFFESAKVGGFAPTMGCVVRFHSRGPWGIMASSTDYWLAECPRPVVGPSVRRIGKDGVEYPGPSDIVANLLNLGSRRADYFGSYLGSQDEIIVYGRKAGGLYRVYLEHTSDHRESHSRNLH